MSLTTRKRQAKALPPAARERAQQAVQQLAPIAKSAKESAAQLAPIAKSAKENAAQLAPIAKSAKENAAHRIHDARLWAAPRVEHAAQSVQENVAPKVSAVLEATAHRIEPTQAQLEKLSRRARRQAEAASRGVSARRMKMLAKADKPKRRWAKVTGGIAVLAITAGAVTAVAMRRNRDKMEADLDDAALAATEMTDEARSADAEAGFDGQVRTPGPQRT